MWCRALTQIPTATQVYEPNNVYWIPDKQAAKWQRSGLVEITDAPDDDPEFPFEIEYHLIQKDNQWTLDDTDFDKTTKTDYHRANQAIESALRNLNTWRGETGHAQYGLCPLGDEYILVGPPNKQAKQMLVQASQNIWTLRKPTYRIVRTPNLIGRLWWTVDTTEFARADYHPCQEAILEALQSLRIHITLTGDYGPEEPQAEYQLVHTEATGYFLCGEPTAYLTLRNILMACCCHIWHDGKLPPYIPA